MLDETVCKEWANNNTTCRAVIVTTVSDGTTLKHLADIEQQCEVAGWVTWNLFRACPAHEMELPMTQRALHDFMQQLKRLAEVAIYVNTGRDIEAAYLAGYLMSARVPVIVMGKPLTSPLQFEQLIYCKSAADLQLFLDNYTRYDGLPTVEQRLRRAASMTR